MIPAGAGAPGLIMIATSDGEVGPALLGILLSMVGAAAGFITAAVFDALDAYAEPPPEAEPAPATALVLPSLGVSADGSPVLGLVGRF
ncbi:MAG: hypothetical protein H6730_38445 [Deltaproteobacteria bacterium]|nr:hypothetical protein [Deltaproteobacteria bacterium]